MAAQEMTFDAAPVKQDTPVSQPAASTPDAGMTFDSSPVKQDTPVQQTTAPNGMPAMQAVANEQTPEG